MDGVRATGCRRCGRNDQRGASLGLTAHTTRRVCLRPAVLHRQRQVQRGIPALLFGSGVLTQRAYAVARCRWEAAAATHENGARYLPLGGVEVCAAFTAD